MLLLPNLPLKLSLQSKFSLSLFVTIFTVFLFLFSSPVLAEDWTPPEYTIDQTAPYYTSNGNFTVTGTATDYDDDANPGSIGFVQYDDSGTQNYVNCSLTSGMIGDPTVSFSCSLSGLSGVSNIEIYFGDNSVNMNTQSAYLDIITTDAGPNGSGPYTNYCYNSVVDYTSEYSDFRTNSQGTTSENCFNTLCPSLWSASHPICEYDSQDGYCSVKKPPSGGVENCIWVTDSRFFSNLRTPTDDSTPPTLTINTPLNTFTDSIDVTGTVTDTKDDASPGVVKKVRFKISSGSTWTNCTATSGTFGVSSSVDFTCHLTGLINGLYDNVPTFQFDSYDTDNNYFLNPNFYFIPVQDNAPAGDYSNYCYNSGSVASTEYNSPNADTWEHCYSWCQANWTTDNPVCTYFPAFQQCELKAPPASGVNTCQWTTAALENGTDLSTMGAALQSHSFTYFHTHSHLNSHSYTDNPNPSTKPL